MSVTAIFVMSAVVVFITVFCFVATRYSMFCDEKPREQRNYLYPPDCRRPNPCAYVVITSLAGSSDRCACKVPTKHPDQQQNRRLKGRKNYGASGPEHMVNNMLFWVVVCAKS